MADIKEKVRGTVRTLDKANDYATSKLQKGELEF